MHPTAGDFVEARGRRWLVEAVSPGSITRHSLVCVDEDAQGETLEAHWATEIGARLSSDDGWAAMAAAQPDDPQVLGAHLRAMRWRTASAADRKLFQAPFRAGIRIDAYQLLPLQRALDLPRANLLIADDVGLGKTVEAGLIARELLLRRRIDFILITAPSSMVLQWQDEMAQKFGLDVTIVDREHLLRTRRARGFGANPWALGSCFAVSHSLLSDEAYMASLREMLGPFRARSLLILDEAHHAAPASGQAYAVESQMTRAVRELAARFEHRLFLSATPHNGHSNSFATLLEMLDPQRFTRGIDVDPADLEPVMIRRLKEDLRQLGQPFPERQVEPIIIDDLPPEAPELRLAQMLRDYWTETGGGSGNRLLLGVLQQRLFSSLAAFARSLRAHKRTLERRAALAEVDPPEIEEDVESDRLLDDDALVASFTTSAPVEASGIEQVDAMLEIAEAHAYETDARVEHLLAWIDSELLDDTSWRDRRLILFTEWEDTRRWLVRMLKAGLEKRGVDHAGRIAKFTGQTPIDERDRIKRAFNAPFEEEPIRILVCTDAAREGINLQARCHDLIHFDLPWNPSRLEQRNGRIDRKLQPHPFVSCRYFVYQQREEDRVLDALMRKTETIRRELGPAGQVIQDKIERRLARGILSGTASDVASEVVAMTSSKAAVSSRELGDAGRLERLRKQEAELTQAREAARSRVGVAPEDLRAMVELSLGRMGTGLQERAFSVPGAGALSPSDPAFAASHWQTLIDELRPGRPPMGRALSEWREKFSPRGVVFEPPRLEEGQPEPQDVVQLHLEHRLVKRLIERFVARGFQDELTRVAAVRSSAPQPRVVLMARLALYGPGARRLHEEIITLTARWRDRDREAQPLQPFGEAGEQTTLQQLQDALQAGVPAGSAAIAQIAPWVGRDVEDLQAHLETRRADARRRAADQLAANGDREAAKLQDLLSNQLNRIEKEREDYVPPQTAFDFRSDDEQRQAERERRQREADKVAWDSKIDRLREELKTEPQRVRDGYEVKAERLDPIGLVYLWPAA